MNSSYYRNFNILKNDYNDVNLENNIELYFLINNSKDQAYVILYNINKPMNYIYYGIELKDDKYELSTPFNILPVSTLNYKIKDLDKFNVYKSVITLSNNTIDNLFNINNIKVYRSRIIESFSGVTNLNDYFKKIGESKYTNKIIEGFLGNSIIHILEYSGSKILLDDSIIEFYFIGFDDVLNRYCDNYKMMRSIKDTNIYQNMLLYQNVYDNDNPNDKLKVIMSNNNLNYINTLSNNINHNNISSYILCLNKQSTLDSHRYDGTIISAIQTLNKLTLANLVDSYMDQSEEYALPFGPNDRNIFNMALYSYLYADKDISPNLTIVASKFDDDNPVSIVFPWYYNSDGSVTAYDSLINPKFSISPSTTFGSYKTMIDSFKSQIKLDFDVKDWKNVTNYVVNIGHVGLTFNMHTDFFNNDIIIYLLQDYKPEIDKLKTFNEDDNILNESSTGNKALRHKIESKIYGTMDILDKTKSNSKKYRQKYSRMSDDEFIRHMKSFVRKNDNNFYMEFLQGENYPKLDDVIETLDYLKVPKDEYVYFRHDGNKDNPLRTRYRVPVG